VPEFREVYDMVTEQRPPVPDALQRQRRRQRRSLRNRKLGTIALSAALVVVAVLVVVLSGTDATNQRKVTNEPAGEARLPSEPGAYLFDLDSRQAIHVAGIEPPGYKSPGIAVSPDGTMVAYRGTDPNGDSVLYVANVDANIRALERTAHSVMGPVGPEFSPDGSQIVYQAKGSGGFVGDIFLVDVASGETTQVTHLRRNSGFWYMGPNFSPDGQRIFFTLPSVGQARQRWDLWSVPALGGEPKLVLRGAIGGRVSPDGRSIVYFKLTPSPGNWFLGAMWLADADGSDPQRVTGVKGDVFSARWSPDGTRIAFTDQRSAYVVDLATGEASRVLDRVGITFPEWVDGHTWILS
jgi:dipeptidyl aminopeptidase/acylaminoacyl peptidase